jgi:2-methylfumaryl-CoA isomerase
MTDGPLQGLRIIDLSTYVAGPSCGMALAQLGADVIRIDPLGGAPDTRRLPLDANGRSLYWAGLNKCKRSVELDLSTDEGRDAATRLIVAAGEARGIVLTNGSGHGWLGYERLRRHRGDLIYVQILGRADGKPAVDYTINAQVGLPYLTGSADSANPVNHVLPVWDLLTGLHAAIAILTAERRRTRTGEGSLVTVSLADVASATMAHLGFVADRVLNGHPRERDGNYLYGDFGRDFITRDGRHVMVVALTARHWHKLVSLTGVAGAVTALGTSLDADFDDEGTRYRHRHVLGALLAPWFEARPYQEVAAALDAARALWGPYRTIDDLVAAPDSLIRSSNVFCDVEHPGLGMCPAPRSVLSFDGQPPDRTPRAPTPGQDTRRVLSEVLGAAAGNWSRSAETAAP